MRITVSLREGEFERLAQLARAERRPVRDQAAVLLSRGLADVPAPAEPERNSPHNAERLADTTR
jgi:hypothetical protein